MGYPLAEKKRLENRILEKMYRERQTLPVLF